MKNINRLVLCSGYLGVVFCLIINTNSLLAQWVQTNPPNGRRVQALATSPNGAGGTNLFAGTWGGGVFLSTDNGISWTAVNTGLWFPYVWTLGVSPNGSGSANLFAGTYAGVFHSTNNGTNWTKVWNRTNVSAFATIPNGTGGINLFAGTSDGIFLSTNNGTSWISVDTGLTYKFTNAFASISNEAGGTNLFAGVSGGVFLSTNNGTSWTKVNNGLMRTRVLSLATIHNESGSTNLFAGTDSGGVFLSTNNGASWTDVSLGFTNMNVRSLATIGTNLFAGTSGGGIFLSTDNGTNWINTGLTGNNILALATIDTNLFAGTYSDFIFLTTDNGTNWTALDTKLMYTDINAFITSPNETNGRNLFAGTIRGLFLSSDDGISWTKVWNNISVYALGSTPKEIGGMNLFAGTNGGVFLSTDDGTNWIHKGLADTTITAFATIPNIPNGTNLFAGTSDNGVYLSTNNGTSWTAVNNGFPVFIDFTTGDTAYMTISALAINPNGANGWNLFAGTAGFGVFLSTNNGASWSAVNDGLTHPAVIRAFATSPATGETGGTNLFVGTSLLRDGPAGGAFLSTNNGTNWTKIEINSNVGSVFAFETYTNGQGDTCLFAGTNGSGLFPTSNVFLSTNNGTSWTMVGIQGIIDVIAFATIYDGMGGAYLIAGTSGGGVFRRPLSEMITGVEEKCKQIPSHFTLGQNYPNPFNPSTKINYTVPVGTRHAMSLRIFDLLGREIATLVNETRPAGSYQVEWNAGGFPSGVYFYRLQSGSYSETKKLLLLK